MNSTGTCLGCGKPFDPIGPTGQTRKYCRRQCGQNAYQRYRRAAPRPDLVLPDEKRCTKCGETKSSNGFYHDNGRPDGLDPWCKLCHAKKNAASYDPAYERARWQRYYADPEVQAHERARHNAKYHEDIEKSRAQQRISDANHRERRQNYWKHDYERKLAWLHEQKARRGCSRCPERHPACLEFHHLDPSQKLFNISDMLHKRWPVDRVRDELEKCVCLCSNCHRKSHWEERRGASVIDLDAPLPES